MKKETMPSYSILQEMLYISLCHKHISSCQFYRGIYYLDQTDGSVLFFLLYFLLCVVVQPSVKSAAMSVAGLPKVKLCAFI